MTELTRARQELLDRLMQSETLKGRNEEARLHKELAALQVGG